MPSKKHPVHIAFFGIMVLTKMSFRFLQSFPTRKNIRHDKPDKASTIDQF